MRLLGCLDVGSGWCFDALQVAGVENTIVDGISRWETEDIDGNLRTSARSGPTLLGTDRYWGQRASRYASECWRPAHPSVSCAVVSPSLYVRFPVLGRYSGVDRGG